MAAPELAVKSLPAPVALDPREAFYPAAGAMHWKDTS